MNGLTSNGRLYAAMCCLIFVAACSPANGQKEDATAVHKAETAAGSVDEIMAYGKKVYEANCAACHQPDGAGLKGAFPPLAGSVARANAQKKLLCT